MKSDVVLTREAHAAIVNELAAIKTKVGRQFASRHEALGVLLEEFEELKDEIKNNGSTERLRAEAVQVAAVAIRIFQELS